MTKTFIPYTTSEEISEVVSRFESCDFAAGEFHHSYHITVALCYLLESKEDEACERMRTGLLRFLKHHGSPDAYHETITVFWIKFVRHLLDQVNEPRSLVDLANSVVAACGNARLIDIHFSAERLASDVARKSWVEPDLQELKSSSTRSK